MCVGDYTEDTVVLYFSVEGVAIRTWPCTELYISCFARNCRSSSCHHTIIHVVPLYTSRLSIELDMSLLPIGHQLSMQDREELRIALTAAQESAIIQLLLEICLPTDEDRKVTSI